MITLADSLERREFSDPRTPHPNMGYPMTIETAIPVTRQELDAAARRHGPRFIALARRYLSCEAECADAVQDAFVSALRQLHKFRGTCKLDTWLHRIVVNACLMRRRARARRPTVQIDALLSVLNEPSEHQSVIREETLTVLRDALKHLPERQRMVIQLRYFEEFNTAETAELLGINASAVKTRLHRSCRALRLLLDDIRVESY